MSWVNIDYARSVVMKMYKSDTWRKRVQSMPNEQILAIYYQHENDNKTKSKTVDDNKPFEKQFAPKPVTQLKIRGIF